MGSLISVALDRKDGSSPESSPELHLISEILPFDNMPIQEIEGLWSSLYEHANSFAITKTQMKKIFISSGYRFGHSPADRSRNAEYLFDAVVKFSSNTTSSVPVVDAMEVFSAIAFISDVCLEKKIRLTFDSFDMSEDGRVDLDEFTISLNSVISGLHKIDASNQSPGTIDENEVEEYAETMFRKIAEIDDSMPIPNNSKIHVDQFVSFCMEDDEMRDVFETYSNAEGEEINSDIEQEAQVRERTPEQFRAMDRDENDESEFDRLLESGGDEFLAVKPWIGAIVSPTIPPKSSTSLPELSLKLDWIYGYQAQEIRNNLMYTKQGTLAYTAAAVGVVMDVKAHTQNFVLAHTDDIISYAMSPSREIVATGEVGKVPKIVLWDVITAETLCSIRGFHKRGVCSLAFDGTASYLTTVGLDDDHSIAVYHSLDNWKSFVLCCTSKGSKAKPLGVSFNPSESSTFVISGVKDIRFWTISGSLEGLKTVQLSCKKAILGKKGTQQPFLCIAWQKNGKAGAIVGTADGSLYSFTGNQLTKVVSKAHQSSVNVLYSSRNLILSGGKDGNICGWSESLELTIGPFNLVKLISSPMNQPMSIRSLCLSEDGSKILVGTQGSEIYELDARSGENIRGINPLLSAHFKHELWGIAVHPYRQEIATVGDDRTLRVWDLRGSKLVSGTVLDEAARACAYSPDGKRIAVGYGSSLNEKKRPVSKGKCVAGKNKNGALAIFNSSDLVKVVEIPIAKRWISDIKYSPDGKWIVVGSHDQKVYICDVQGCLKKKLSFNKHSSYITHLDISKDSQYVQSNCGAYELLFCDLSSGEHITSATSLRDVCWQTWTCTLGWPVQGIWPACADGTDINAVCRSFSESFLATADDFGRVKVYNYPCTGGDKKRGKGKSQDPLHLEFRGHSSHVTNLRWSLDDEFLLSIGGNDRCIFQWKNTSVSEQEQNISCNNSQKKTKYPPHFDEPECMDSDETSTVSSSQDSGDVVFEGDFGGDEFMAIKPWLGAIVAPTKPPMEDLSSPSTDMELELEWVHGYQSEVTRNNVRYSCFGHAVYNAAALGIVYDMNSKSQYYAKGNTDDITSIALHPNGKIVATGQVGKNALIYVWEIQENGSTRSLASIKGFHKRAVSALEFSSCGKYLGSIGDDDDHSFAIYNWKSENLVASSKGERYKVLSLSHHEVDSSWISCGVNHIKFWTAQGCNLSAKKGILGKKGRIQTFLCASQMRLQSVVGSMDGSLYVFQSNRLSSVICNKHKGPVYALSYSATFDKLVSGGKDGRINVYSGKTLDTTSSFIPVLESFCASIRSVCLNPSKEELVLIGTQGSEIVEVSTTNAEVKRLITRGHYKAELWGLSQHPFKDEFATVGDDKTLRTWSVTNREILQQTDLGCMARAVGYSPDGNLIAVGMGGSIGRGTKQKKNGCVVVLDANNVKNIIFEDRPSKEWISDVKFSPNGKILAVGSHDNNIYFYTVNATQKSVTKRKNKSFVFGKHNSYITHFDFSKDSQYLQTCQQVTSATSLRDVEWSTWSCTLGWPVQGIWPACADGTDINAVCRSNNERFLATADDSAKVKLFRYPCLTPVGGSTSKKTRKKSRKKNTEIMPESESCKMLEYSGHSSHVMNIIWTLKDSHIITVGGNDRCIFQWKCKYVPEEEKNAYLLGEEIPQPEETNGILSCEESVCDEIEFEIHEGGDEFMAVKPWLGAIVRPTNAPSDNPATPDVEINLEWVYGYQAQFSRNNVKVSHKGSIIYYAAAVGVIFNKETHQQIHHIGHSDDIISMDMTLDGRYVATGERGKRPKIHVWDSESGQLLSALDGFHYRGVVSLAFSHEQSLLCSVGDDDEHSVALWEDSGGGWNSAKLKATSRGDRNRTLFVCSFNKEAPFQMATGGVKHVKFWTLHGSSLTSKKGQFGKKAKVQTAVCGVVIKNELISGMADGNLYVWKGSQISSILKSHEGSVTALYSNGTTMVISGGSDGKIVVWSCDGSMILSQVKTLEVDSSSFDRSVRSVFPTANKASLVVGTLASEIFEMNLKESGSLSVPLIQAHYKDELWGLSPHPTNCSVVATVGDDSTVRIWDMERKKQLKCAKLPNRARACAYSPDGKFLAIGLGGDVGTRIRKPSKGSVKDKDGVCMVLDANDLNNVLFKQKLAKEWISDVKFSPNGSQVAFGSHDNRIYFVEFKNGSFTYKKCKFNKHNSYITHLDFSRDGTKLQSNCGAYEYLFCDTESCTQITSASSVKDVMWDTWTCTLGWPVQGIWPECADGTDINAVCASNSRTLLATSDDFGKVKLFRYPCANKQAKYIEGRGHSSHVTNVRFNSMDQYLLSTGGNDRCLFQWKICTKQ